MSMWHSIGTSVLLGLVPSKVPSSSGFAKMTWHGEDYLSSLYIVNNFNFVVY
jgi:hypothetical protein